MSLAKEFLGPRVFRRLGTSLGESKPHDFFLERMATYQLNNKVPFVAGPAIIAEPCKDEYDYWGIARQIETSLRYYMKPYNIHLFGKDERNIELSHLLVRLFLQGTTSFNNALVLMERVDLSNYITVNNVNNYMTAINNRSWQPDNTVWDTLQNKYEIQQTLRVTDEPYPGSWQVNMRLM